MSIRWSPSATSVRDRGAAAVEMAIIFPLLFLVLAGIVDFGRAFFYQIQLTNAAREGARAAIVTDGSVADITARAASSAPAVPDLAVAVELCGGGVTVTTVTVSMPMEWFLLQPAMNIIQAGNVLTDTLSSTAVMQCES
ncbi:TadE/TadG family type IV pilus assembly protein [Intrasporangium calvum]|uniref:TadE/TadG family type IV pilus assembly protein n=1 Tax=Intrasporangium calvum TaxID=53358 RepID=UPI000DF60D99|nr:TadE family protein [Intrasporangium calvum]AXG12322.1 pilus assembly protein [Intrasporangium calvum]